MIKVWADNAWEDYLYWQGQDRKTLKAVNKLLTDIERDPFSSLGKPEPLKHRWSDYWSRRIDEQNRLIYRIEGGRIEIAQCRSHYDD
jgi:toxin YoeB